MLTDGEIMNFKKRLALNNNFEIFEITVYDDYGNKIKDERVAGIRIKNIKTEEELPVKLLSNYGFSHLENIYSISFKLKNTPYKVIKDKTNKKSEKPYYTITKSGVPLQQDGELLRFDRFNAVSNYIDKHLSKL